MGRKGTTVNFTHARVSNFGCPDGTAEAVLWDSGAAGLGLRARAAGSKTYVFVGRVHGRQFRMTIGSADTWDIQEARAEARRLAVLVDQGVDPREERRARDSEAAQLASRAAAGTVTVGEAWQAYIEDRSGSWSKVHVHDHHQVMTPPGRSSGNSKRGTRAGVLYAIQNAPLSDLTADRLGDWLEAETKLRPTLAARGYRMLRAFLNWCDDHPDYGQVVDAHALLTKRVRRSVPQTRAKADCLQREQLGPWFGAIETLNRMHRSYLQCLLLTGARPNELARLRWADVDFRWAVVTLRDKSEGERRIPLTPHVAGLLQELPRYRRSDDDRPIPWVFASPRTESGRMGEANHAHSRALRDAGLPHLTLHGLRRSFGTLSEWVECPVGVVAQIQGHKPSATAEKHYRVRPLDLLRKWHTSIEAWILEQAANGSDDNVSG